ncbi:MAG: 23S rRNA (pseudouridine(1915)-N(3))-methyltransferase RlmH [Chitinophagaceae bacterium]
MKLTIAAIGKAHEVYVKNGVDDFTKRITHYYPVSWHIIPSPRNAGALSEMELRKKEGDLIMDWLKKDDFLILLDKRGRQVNSEGLASLIQTRANNSTRHLVFLIGGAFGLDEAVLKRADFTWSLSQLVFPHQLVRLIIAEQLYRACTIIRHEKYHHS